MLRLKLTDKLLGQYLAKPIYNREGKLLIAEETVLTEPIIKNLKDSNILVVYITAFPDLIYKDELFPDNQKVLMLTNIDELYNLIKSALPIIEDITRRDDLYAISDKITRKISGIVSGLIDIVYYFDDKTLKNFIEYRFMYPFFINKIILNSIYAAYTAKALNINKFDIEKLLSAIITLDIGFYKLPENLINRNNYYNHEEAGHIMKHPIYSFNILRNIIGFDSVTASLIYMSHERIDGSGYPRKLKDKEIPELAQIIGITDTFTELKYSSKYKNMISPELLYDLITCDSFAKEISSVFVNAIPPYPIGTTVFLNNGELGVVVDFDYRQPFRPVVRKLDAGNLYSEIIEYNLKTDKELNITGYVW